MTQASNMSKMARKAGALLAILGLLAFFAGVFSFLPKMIMFVGIALIVLSLVAYYIEELGQRRQSVSADPR
ncbi:MAG: hypothetical protein ACKVRN_10120 [Pyrinomonadaceae bacterium]